MKTHLVFGVITVLLLAIVIGTRKQETFSFDSVVEMAEGMAREGYMSAISSLPKTVKNFNYDQYRDIRWRDERTLWRKEGLPFQARFFHPGYLFQHPVEIYVVDKGSVEQLPYSQDSFDFGKNTITERFPRSLGYAGFRIHHPLNKPDVLDEVVAFLGSSYFRAAPKNLQYGLSARGLAIDTALDKKEEEFPVFTKFWLKKPERSARTFTLFALLESKSVTGAYQFEISPGTETHMNVKAVLFFRKKSENVGFAPLTSMYWFGENTSNTFGDFRPEVHDSDGLLMQRQSGEWVWRPLNWAKHLQVNTFPDDHPKGFGLLQRDRDFNHYQDLEAHYHDRPSLWVQPLYGFDKGEVRLVQIATKDEFMDNIVAFWTPAEAPPLLQPVRIEYNLRWFRDANDLPPVGRCISTRVDYQHEAYYRQFFLEFSGGSLDRLKPDTEKPTAEVTSITGAAITEVEVQWNDYNRSWRVSFMASTPEDKKPMELACRLVRGEEVLTETWSYTWTQ